MYFEQFSIQNNVIEKKTFYGSIFGYDIQCLYHISTNNNEIDNGLCLIYLNISKSEGNSASINVQCKGFVNI